MSNEEHRARARELLGALGLTRSILRPDSGKVELVASALAQAFQEGKAAQLPRAAVAGDWTTLSIRELARRCEILLAEEQEQPLPDNALIGCLCDCVRMTREFERFPPIRATEPPPSPPSSEADRE